MLVDVICNNVDSYCAYSEEYIQGSATNISEITGSLFILDRIAILFGFYLHADNISRLMFDFHADFSIYSSNTPRHISRIPPNRQMIHIILDHPATNLFIRCMMTVHTIQRKLNPAIHSCVPSIVNACALKAD